jgi:hypothetical protein
MFFRHDGKRLEVVFLGRKAVCQIVCQWEKVTFWQGIVDLNDRSFLFLQSKSFWYEKKHVCIGFLPYCIGVFILLVVAKHHTEEFASFE